MTRRYWGRHMCQKVQFAAGLDELLKDGDRVMVEVGAGQTLGALIKQQARYGREGSGQVIVPTLPAVYQKQAEQDLLLGSLGKLWLAGVQPDWVGFYARERRRRIGLPTYPFERQRYWVEPGEATVAKKASRLGAGKNPVMAEWFYEARWREAELAARGAGKGSSCWLLFADANALSSDAAAGLKHAGHNVITVHAGDEFRKHDAEGYEIRPGEADDYDRLIRQLQEAGRLPGRIAHLWNATPGVEAVTTADDFARWQNLGYYSLIYTMQALAKQLVLDPLEVVMVSSNMQAVSGDEPLCPAKATLLGPCKGIPQESPHIICRSVDMEWSGGEADRDTDATRVTQLVAELMSESVDPVVAYRHGRRLVQDFEPVRVEPLEETETRLRPQGVYLITGGLGNVGMILARHLAAAVQARLVLVGRSGLPPRERWSEWLEEHGEQDSTSQRISNVRSIEELGADVRVVAADVADEQEMANAVDVAYQSFGTLHGVVHAAGVTDGWAFRVVQEIGPTDSEDVFRPKVHGLMALEKALDGKDLDFCLLTSSVSSVLAGIKLVSYSAANIFMDAFAHRHNRDAAVPWLSVNWDTWRVKADPHGALGKTIAEFEMSPEEGCEAFERLIFRYRGGHVVESTGDIETRLNQWIRRTHLGTSSDPASPKKPRSMPGRICTPPTFRPATMWKRRSPESGRTYWALNTWASTTTTSISAAPRFPPSR